MTKRNVAPEGCDTHDPEFKIAGMDQRWHRKADPGKKCTFCRCQAETKHCEPAGNWVPVCARCLCQASSLMGFALPGESTKSLSRMTMWDDVGALFVFIVILAAVFFIGRCSA